MLVMGGGPACLDEGFSDTDADAEVDALAPPACSPASAAR